MSTIRTTLYLKSGVGPKPYRTCYFAVSELERLQQDWEQYQQKGEPTFGTYHEEIGVDQETAVLVEFSALAQIKTTPRQ
jgi:hypothetical protein